MNILITGASGFVGSNLSEFLWRSGFIIDVLDLGQEFGDYINKAYHWKDVESINFDSYDVVIHLAGKAHDTKNRSLAEEYFRINTGLTQTIYDYFLKSSANKFIFFSSVKAAADFVPGDVLFEDVVPAPVGAYGESKIKAEEYIQSKSAPANKSVYILRPCMIHGRGNKGNLNLLYNVVKKGIPWPLGSFDNRRSFTSIDNLCYLIDSLIKSNIPSDIFNIADDDAISTNRLIEIMCKVEGKDPSIWHINKKIIKSIANMGDLLHLPLNSIRLKKLTENYVVSNSKIKKALQIEALPLSSEEGLYKTLESFR